MKYELNVSSPPACPPGPPKKRQHSREKERPPLVRAPQNRRYKSFHLPPSVSSDRTKPLPFPFDGASMMTCGVVLLALSQTNCWPVRPDEPETPTVELLGLRPNADVGPLDPVSIAFSEPVSLIGERWPVAVKSGDTFLATDLSFSDSHVDLVITPDAPWPPGQEITVELGEGLADSFGRTLTFASPVMTFSTRWVEPAAPGLALRYPPLGRSVPLNLRWIAVVSSGFDEVPREVVVERGTQTIRAEVMRSAPGGVLLARLPEHRGPCDPLCPDSSYSLGIDGATRRLASAPGEVRTATIGDFVIPTVTATRVAFAGDEVTLEVESSEPVLLYAKLVASDGNQTPIALPLIASASFFIEAPPEVLVPESAYNFVIEGEDIAGNALAPFEVPLRAPPRIEVAINEVVPAPFHDWSDSEENGEAYDARPGVGAVTDTDEWIELVNHSAFPIDLRSAGLVLRVHDSSPTTTSIDGVTSLYFGNGGSRSAWWPGEALVFHPRGSIAQRGFTLELMSGTRELDRLVVGEEPNSAAVSGTPPSLEYEAFARDEHGRFRWCAPTPGDPLPPAICQ